MALVSVLPRALDEPLPLDVLADLASRASRHHARSNPTPVAFPGGRWHVRLRITAHYDVWLIGWGAESLVEMHDHGVSAGALAVTHGTLVEHTPRPSGGVRQQALAAGDVHAFEPGHRHDVVNDGPAVAMSVHVYSPPLSAMTFYDDAGTAVRTEAVDLSGLIEDR